MGAWCKIVMNNWLILALAAMLIFSISNTLLKVASDQFDIAKSLAPLLPAAAIALIVFLIGTIYVLFIQKAPVPITLLEYGAAIVILSLLGVALFLASLKTGKVAEVTAILSISTIVVALISIHFLKVEFNAKEIIGMLMAVASILLFVL